MGRRYGFGKLLIGGATLCIRPYAVAIALSVPERIFDLQRISWHSEGVKNELDRDGLQQMIYNRSTNCVGEYASTT